MKEIFHEELGATSYIVIEESIVFEGEEILTYGIAVNGKDEQAFIPNVTSEKGTAIGLAERFVQYAVSPIHLQDVIYDCIS